MTLQPLPSEFPYIYEENFILFFISVLKQRKSEKQIGRSSLFNPALLIHGYTPTHRLNMEVDLQSLFGFHVTWCAQLYSLTETQQSPPPSPRIGTRITRALLVSKDRRDPFVTPCSQPKITSPQPFSLLSLSYLPSRKDCFRVKLKAFDLSR
jgi:hypothetical protein